MMGGQVVGTRRIASTTDGLPAGVGGLGLGTGCSFLCSSSFSLNGSESDGRGTGSASNWASGSGHSGGYGKASSNLMYCGGILGRWMKKENEQKGGRDNDSQGPDRSSSQKPGHARSTAMHCGRHTGIAWNVCSPKGMKHCV